MDDEDHARRRLAATLEALPVGVWLVDADRTITETNPAARSLQARASREDGSFAVRSPKRGAPLDLTRWPLQRALANGEIVLGEPFEIDCADGTTMHVLASAAPIRDGEGNVTGAAGALVDITEKTKLEEQLQRSQRMEAIGQLAGGVAHDFNNLLTVITTCASFLREGLPVESSLQADVNDICSAADRAAELTRQLLAFSRRQLLVASTLDLDEVVHTMLPTLRRAIGERFRITFESAPECDHVLADRAQIEQVITNLVSNARDALGEGGRIRIAIRDVDVDVHEATRHDVVAGRHVGLAVIDDGVGMDEEVLARVFEPFFTTKEVGRGTGLGLSTVYGIVRQSGGYVTVESRIGGGSTFEVVLPSGRPCDSHGTGSRRSPRADVRPRPTEAPSSHVRGSSRVLLVEDESALRAVARRLLQREGYTVVEARDGREALQIVEERGERFDLLVTDIVMPELGGRKLFEALRALQPDLGVLYMSGYTDDEILRRGFLDSTVSFLSKPFQGKELMRAVEKALAGAQKTGASEVPTPKIHLK